MSDLNRPIKTVLRDGYAESDIQRLWRGVQERAARRPGERRARIASVALGAAMAAIAVLLLVSWRWHRRPGPLATAKGELPTTFVAEPSPSQVALDDGSVIALDPGSRLDVIGNDGSLFYTVLRSGRALFDVRPHGNRHWTVECGLATVEVVGTRFSCEQRRSELLVSVERGAVLVHGERVPEHVQRVSAGGQLVVSADPRGSHPAEKPNPSEAPPALVDAGVLPPSESDPVQVGAAARTDRGREAITPGGARDAIDDCLARADIARRSGDLETAARLLERVVREARNDQRGSLAAFTLARLTMARNPRRAAELLTAALANRVPRGLEQDARARLVEAYARGGDRNGAERAAADYERRFPTGARLAEVRRWARGE